jgi:radical SAM superfamily enzyme YgiQ (UPF0313 family)
MHYTGPVVRPYTDADSIIVEVTVGCTHNNCTFCNFYKDFPFRVADFSQVEEDLKEAGQIHPHAKNVWASGGNPYALSTEKLATLAKLFKKYLPEAKISTYARVDDLLRKSVDDIRYLKELGFEDLVLGIESGDDEVLKHVNKGYTAADILEGCRRLEEAGVAYRVIYLGGLAGAGKGEESAIRTAKILNQIHPYFMFLTTASIFPGTTLYRQIQDGSFQEESELERIKEYRTLLANMKNKIVVDARNVANMIPFTAYIPENRDDIVKELDRFIENFSQKDEEKMHARRSGMLSV